jgi:hypothetical protein
MKFLNFAIFAPCLALGACSGVASLTPAGPSMTATSGPSVNEEKFAGDAAACRSRAQNATESAPADQLGRQNQYDRVYSDCMLERGNAISQPLASR